MNSRDVRKALLSMGYVERAPGTWLKPIGYQCFGYHEERREWSNWFMTAQGKVALWDAKELLPEYDPLEAIKDWETYTRTDLHYRDPHFELNTVQFLDRVTLHPCQV